MAVTSQWLGHIEAWQRSGLSQTDYCRQQQLNPKTFSARLCDYRKEPPADAPALLPVHVEAAASAAVVVRLAQGHRLELSAAVPAGWLAEVLRCLG